MKSLEELPDELKKRLLIARVQVDEGVLPLPLLFRYVMSILSVFGPRWHVPKDEQQILQLIEDGHETALSLVRGWQRRSWNALLCAEKVAPQWNPDLIPIPEIWSLEEIEGLYSTNLNQVIQEAKFAVRHILPSLIRDTTTVPSVQTVKDAVRHLKHQDRLINRAVYAYDAVETAQIVVCRDEDHEFNVEEEYLLHWHGEWTGVLSVSYSSSAFSIETHNKKFVKDPERLKEFWLWWLDEAVPASWHLRDL